VQCSKQNRRLLPTLTLQILTPALTLIPTLTLLHLVAAPRWTLADGVDPVGDARHLDRVRVRHLVVVEKMRRGLVLHLAERQIDRLPLLAIHVGESHQGPGPHLVVVATTMSILRGHHHLLEFAIGKGLPSHLHVHPVTEGTWIQSLIMSPAAIVRHDHRLEAQLTVENYRPLTLSDVVSEIVEMLHLHGEVVTHRDLHRADPTDMIAGDQGRHPLICPVLAGQKIQNVKGKMIEPDTMIGAIMNEKGGDRATGMTFTRAGDDIHGLLNNKFLTTLYHCSELVQFLRTQRNGTYQGTFVICLIRLLYTLCVVK